jgi:hypothetical protein
VLKYTGWAFRVTALNAHKFCNAISFWALSLTAQNASDKWWYSLFFLEKPYNGYGKLEDYLWMSIH